MLLAKLVAVDNLEEAFKWKVLSQLRMKIDALKCKDQSVTEGINIIEHYFLDTLFDLMVNYYEKNTQPDNLTNKYINQEFNRRNRNAIIPALKYHSEHEYQVDYPYWLANHGMNHITALMKNNNLSKKELFVLSSDWKKEEEQLIQAFQKAAEKS